MRGEPFDEILAIELSSGLRWSAYRGPVRWFAGSQGALWVVSREDPDFILDAEPAATLHRVSLDSGAVELYDEGETVPERIVGTAAGAYGVRERGSTDQLVWYGDDGRRSHRDLRAGPELGSFAGSVDDFVFSSYCARCRSAPSDALGEPCDAEFEHVLWRVPRPGDGVRWPVPGADGWSPE